MGKDASPLFAEITRDRLSGLSCYMVSQGTSMSHAQLSSRTSFIPEPSSTQMESPALSQFSCDTSDTSSSAGAWQADEDYLPLQTKDPKLQVYFLKMEKTLRTCHPAAIQAEATNLTRNIVANPSDLASSIRSVAETLAKAGYRKVEYSRSCALVAYEVFLQLQSISRDASISFRDCLINDVMKVFDGYYLKVNLWHLGGLNGLSSVEDEMINIAAFVGDLFAFGMLPLWMVNETILMNLAYANQVSTIHCRALHLFLLHAKAHIGSSIGHDTLVEVRRQLIRCSRGSPMAYDKMAQLWVIECCTVIDQTLEQTRLARRGPVTVPHQWEMSLSKTGWFSTLVS